MNIKTALRLFGYLMFASLVMTSCEKEAIDPLSGIYTPATSYSLTTLSSQSKTKTSDGQYNIFSINVTDDSGNALDMQFIASDYFLPASDFTASETPVKNTYLIGTDGSTFNGGQITSGTLSVAFEDSVYTMSGILYLADESVINVNSGFTIVYEQPQFAYTNTITVPATYGMAGTAIDGSQLNHLTVTNGTDTVAVFELITAEGVTSLSGDYNVLDGSGSTMAIGDANSGYYVDMSWFGGEGIVTGGCYYISNSEAQYIRAGSVIHVDDSNGTLTISGSNLYIQDISTGSSFGNKAEMGNLTYTDVSLKGLTMTNVFSASAMDLSAYGGTGYDITLKISTDGVTAVSDGAGGFTFTGNGNYVSIDFLRDDATLTAGTYNIVSNESATTGDCVAGYPALYGDGLWGSVWGTVTDGTASDTAITGGTVDVSEADGIYSITVNATIGSGRVKATYSGAITIQ